MAASTAQHTCNLCAIRSLQSIKNKYSFFSVHPVPVLTHSFVLKPPQHLTLTIVLRRNEKKSSSNEFLRCNVSKTKAIGNNRYSRCAAHHLFQGHTQKEIRSKPKTPRSYIQDNIRNENAVISSSNVHMPWPCIAPRLLRNKTRMRPRPSGRKPTRWDYYN